MDDKLSDIEYEPRIERPPKPPNAALYSELMEYEDCLKEWDSIFISEIKLCGERLQRHSCRKVCFKNLHGNPHDTCRFNFPRAVVDYSYFDDVTQSIVFACHDGTVNNYNPYILVFARHNHDLKCILLDKLQNQQ